MPALTVTAKGQVTLNKDVLRHMGIKPGDKIEYVTFPDGTISIKAYAKKKNIVDIIGMFDGKTDKRVSVEQMNKDIADGYISGFKFDE